MRSLVHGFAIAGESTAVALRRYGHEVAVTDDAIDSAKEQRAVDAGFSLGSLPDGDALDAFVRQFDLIAPAPVCQNITASSNAQRAGVTISVRSKSHTQRSSNVTEGPDRSLR